MAKRLTLFAFLFCCIQLIWSQTSAIDKARSKVTVRVYKSGLFSAFAHDHTISAPISSGELDPTARRVQVSFHAADMKVVDDGVKDSERAEIESTIKGDKVLDAQKYPDIIFTSRSVETRDGKTTVQGNLSLHGSVRPVQVVVASVADHYSGTVKLKQTEFGITPVKVAGGTVKVKDEIEILFEVYPVR
jgi:polyisoprenoid-binding protein YceI